jgi:hypothetical protein
VPNTQIDGCWLENNGRFGYTANYSSGTISSYTIGRDGSLTLLDPVAGTTNELPNPAGDPSQGSTPLDLRLSRDGRSLYTVLPGSGAVGGWRVNRDGSLTKIGEFGGLSRTVNGDHAPVEFGSGGSPGGHRGPLMRIRFARFASAGSSAACGFASQPGHATRKPIRRSTSCPAGTRGSNEEVNGGGREGRRAGRRPSPVRRLGGGASGRDPASRLLDGPRVVADEDVQDLAGPPRDGGMSRLG